MTPPAQPAAPQPPSSERTTANQRITSGLVALSSAAILAVYSAGYVRTRAASERVIVAAAERRPPPLASLSSGADPFAIEEPTAPAAAGSPATGTPSAAEPTLEAQSGAVVGGGNASGGAAAVSSRPAATEATSPSGAVTKSGVSAPSTGGASTPAGASVATAATGSTPAAPVSAATTTATSTAAPTTTADAPAAAPAPPASAPVTTTAAAAKPRYKDGTYSGWGRCRHGDLEATVVITDGRIVSATISQCLTRYPCNTWLAPLPPQVVARQSPNVDYVSGATDSTDAFYGAVYDALFKAR